MRSTVFALAATLAMVSAGQAQTHTDTGGTITAGTFDVSNATKAPQYCQITVTTTAATLVSLLAAASCTAVPSWASVAYVTPQSSGDANSVALRWRGDGVAPTAAIGDVLFGWTKSSDILGYSAINGAQLISATGVSVVVNVRIGG
jgi:hypothetical protein